MKTWFTNRINNVDTQINNLSGSIDNDIAQTAPSCDAVTRYTLAVNAGAGGTVNPSGTSQHNAGASVTVTATPNSGYSFNNGWSGAPTGAATSGNSITFQMNGDVTLTANFTQGGTTTYTLNVNRNPPEGGGVTVNGGSPNPGSSTHNAGASVTVIAAPNNGYEFTEWRTDFNAQLPQGVTANNATATFNINSNVTLIANFAPTGCTNNCFAVTVNVGEGRGGTVNPSGTVQYSRNATAILTATPDEGYRFVGWTVPGGTLPSTLSPNAQSETITFTVQQARTIVAVFEQGASAKQVKALPNGRSIMAVKNGLSLSVNNSADVRVVNLSGREIRKVSLTRGNHTLRFADLPKGMYLVSAVVDGRGVMLRVPVR